MKTLKILILAIVIPLSAQAQVIDETSWDQVSKEKRIPILEQYASIDGCEVNIAFALAANTFRMQSPTDNGALANQKKMIDAMLADKALSTAIKTYCAGQFFNK